MYSEYEKYLLGIRNSLIQNGIEFPEATKESMDYLELFKLGIKLSDILLYYKVLAISGSGDGLDDFILPINTSYVDKMRGICYSEFVTSVLPDYKALSLGIEPEEEPDDIDFEEEEADTSKVADSSEDLFNSMFEEDEEDSINNEDLGNNSIEDKFDANVKQLLQESNIKYVPKGVYVEDIKPIVKDGVENNHSDDDFDFSEDDDNYEDSDEEGYQESNYSEDDDEDFDCSNDEDEESDYNNVDEESDYSEDDEDFDYSDDADEESDYSEDGESDYNSDDESDYSEDDEDFDYSDDEDEESDYSEDDDASDYSEDDDEGFDYSDEESDYSEDDEDFDYSDDDYEESDYSEDEESDYSEDEELDYSEDEESNYSEDEESDYSADDENDNFEGYEGQAKSEGVSTPAGKSKDLSDELQDITNTVLTNIKRKAVNFLKRKE